MGRPKKVLDPENLSPKTREVFEFIKKSVYEKNYPPSVRDICKAVGLKSTSSVFSYINDLEAMGLIKKDPSHPRAIQITALDFRTKDKREIAEIPVLGTVACGAPLLAQENITDFYPMPVEMLPKRQVFFLNVKGDSMKKIGILNGDKVLVEEGSTCSNGDIVVALIDESATVKRFYKEDGHVRLQPENDAMDPIIVPDCRILGRVIGLFRFGIK